MPPAASRLPLVVLVILVLLGAALRVWQAGESLWLDELHTAWCALGTLTEVAPRAMIGNQSPPFFWLEWLLVKSLGPSELTVRLPSLLAGSLLPAALYWLATHWTRLPWLGVLAAWLVVVDPVQIFYATEARPYALVQLLAVAHIGLLAELLERRHWSIHVAFVLVGALLFHLHYTAALLFLAEIAAVAVIAAHSRFQPLTESSSTATSTLRPLFRDGLAIAVLCLPAIPHVLAVFERRANWELFIVPPTYLSLIAVLPWTWTALVVLAGQAFRMFRPSGEAPDSDDRTLSLLALCWLLVPLLLAWILSTSGIARLFFARYLMVSAPAAIILAVLAVRLIPWRLARIAAATAIALAALYTPVIPRLAQGSRPIANRQGDWRSAVAYFNAQSGRDRLPVLVATQLIESEALRGSFDPALVEFCLYPIHSLYPIAADPAFTIPLPRTSPGQLAPSVRDLLASRGGAWLIFAGSDSAANDAAREIVQSVQGPKSKVQGREQNTSVAQRRSFGTVHMIHLNSTEH